MKKIFTSLFFVLLTLTMLISNSTASVALGKKTYKKYFQKQCGFTSVKFARHYTQGEWEEIYEAGILPQKAHTICPNLDIATIEEKQWGNLYEYVYKYAKDGVAPNGCND